MYYAQNIEFHSVIKSVVCRLIGTSGINKNLCASTRTGTPPVSCNPLIVAFLVPPQPSHLENVVLIKAHDGFLRKGNAWNGLTLHYSGAPLKLY